MTNRIGFPKDLKVTGKGTQGESEWMPCANTGILAMRWCPCDKKPIYFLSNIHVAELDGLVIRHYNKKGEAIMVNCTPTVHQYNQYMDAVDYNDKMCRIDKSRRTYKWYVRIDRKCVAWGPLQCLRLRGEIPGAQTQA